MNGKGELVLADCLVCLYTYSKILILMIAWLGLVLRLYQKESNGQYFGFSLDMACITLAA
jgi:hypothetical protein